MMKKKAYIAPVTKQVPINGERLLTSESMAVDGTKRVTSDGQVFSRRDIWVDDEEE